MKAMKAGGTKMKVLKKPAKSGQLALPESSGMSLEEKMAAFSKRGNQDVTSWLDSLTKQQREALWQRFSSARASLKDDSADAMWQEVAKGKGSDPAKKKLLAVFLKLGGDLKAKKDVYMKELITYTKSSGSLAALFPPSTFWLLCSLAQVTRTQKNGFLLPLCSSALASRSA